MFFIDPISIICGVVVGLVVGAVIGVLYRKKIAEARVGVAEERAGKIVEDAVKDAEAKKKEILLEAKDTASGQKMSWKKKSVTEGTSFREMKGGCSKRKRLWTEKSRLWKRKRSI